MKRFLAIFTAFVMMACLGGIYAWSAFAKALQQQFGYSTWQVQSVFGTCIFVFTLTQVFTGPIQDRKGPRMLSVASGLLLGASYTLGWSGGGHFIPLWLAMGVVGGLAIGCGYVCPIANLVKWFPTHKGLVCGVAVAGYGAGAVILSGIISCLLRRSWQVLDIFGLVGVVYCAVVVICGALMPPAPSQNRGRQASFARSQLVRDKRFWALSAAMLCSTLPGLTAVGALQSIGTKFGLTVAVATAAISFFAVGNALGRVSWGFVLDKIGGRRSILLLQLLIALSLVSMVLGGRSDVGFLSASAFVAFCYGGSFAVYPGQVARLFGPEHIGAVYPLVMVAHGLAAAVGPSLGGLGYDLTGSFVIPLYAASAVAITGLITYAVLSPDGSDRLS